MPTGPKQGRVQNSYESDEGLLRSGLKLRHLRLTVALEDHGQISAAAHVMNISQPAASRMIAEIEAILGVEICERLPRGIRLTPFGEVLARRARTILLEMREVDREISGLKQGTGGSVFLGAVTAPAIELAVPAIRKVRQRHPRIEISVQIETSAVLARELLASRHDFIIARIPDDLNPRLFEARIIGVEKACLIARRGHPLSTGKTIDLDQLSHYDWVFQPSGSLLRQTVEGIFVSQGAPLPDRILNTSSLLLTLVMVAQSDAISPIAIDVARFVTGRSGLAGSIDILPIPFEINVQPYSLIKVRDRTLSPTAEMLYEQILREI
ncbi:LysR family transcriptional regulator [Mesorhizobium sp. DCY119]|jgi:DNA-binding transcriptional LysR family regulator|uniref:LysR family transcriptional regulator n=1 Tax=Mesorhizobium sp. DCY119 TaxID=2108445 RepID=UPI000E76A358|nr:LysR family transcriptional regulator [Mesorhizobium sp. DCY119]RJG41078.1 LysR family transcriptional regulator [Mesorhizobium sp. DCY119]